MKSLIKLSMLSVAILILTCGSAIADSFNGKGCTLVPVTVFWGHSRNYTQTSITVSNITGSTVKCHVILYDHDGNEVDSIGTVQSGAIGSHETTISTGTNIFELPPNSTRRYTISKTNTVFGICGYAVVEWTSNDSKLRKALIGEVWRTGIAGGDLYYSGNYILNNGQPF